MAIFLLRALAYVPLIVAGNRVVVAVALLKRLLVG